MKLIAKERVGGRWRRKHDKPRTADQRLLKMNMLGNRTKRQLREQFENLDPFDVTERLEKSLRPILAKAVRPEQEA